MSSAKPSPMLSVVIPVYNEEENLPLLFERTYTALDALEIPYEILFTNDGSTDTSLEVLEHQYKARPDVTCVIDFEGNTGNIWQLLQALKTHGAISLLP